MSSVSNAPSIEGRENTRKAEWATLNTMLRDTFRNYRQAPRLVHVLSKLYFVPTGKAVHTPTLWMWDDDQKRYVSPSDDGCGLDPYARLVSPHDQARLVCDNGFFGHEHWQRAAFWWEATEALSLQRTQQHLDELVEKRQTLWSRGHRRNVLTAVQLNQALAEQVNKIGIENGALAPWVIKPASLRLTSESGWTFELGEPKPYIAKSGDWLGGTKTDGGLYDPAEFPYNGARVYPRVFFEERARFIDTMH